MAALPLPRPGAATESACRSVISPLGGNGCLPVWSQRRPHQRV